jgi:prepilin-type N-terminal cleavage/methylation domain-containing protein
MLYWFAKRLREMQEVHRDERGFTLIELLVVAIIVGILVGIAVSVFLYQRQKAQNSAAQSALRSAATAQTAFYQGNCAWADTEAELESVGWRSTAAVTLTFNAAPDPVMEGGYCMQAEHAASGIDFKVSENGGGVAQGTC